MYHKVQKNERIQMRGPYKIIEKLRKSKNPGNLKGFLKAYSKD